MGKREEWLAKFQRVGAPPVRKDLIDGAYNQERARMAEAGDSFQKIFIVLLPREYLLAACPNCGHENPVSHTRPKDSLRWRFTDGK